MKKTLLSLCMLLTASYAHAGYLEKIMPIVFAKSNIAKEPIWRESADASLKKLLNTKDIKSTPCSKDNAMEGWEARMVKPTFVELHNCNTDVLVSARLYPSSGGNKLVLLTTTAGNHGQTKVFEFFITNAKFEVVSQPKPEDLGLAPVRYNEFVSTKHRFPEKDNSSSSLFDDEDGSIVAAPWTWMNPEWEKRTILKGIKYKWNGERFIKEVMPKVTKKVSVPPPQDNADGLCEKNESEIFHCEFKSHKVASLCLDKTRQTPVSAHYRFGSKQKIELEYPEVSDAQPGKFVLSRATFSGGGAMRIRFKNKGYTYILEDSTVRTGFADGHNDPSFNAGIHVLGPAGKNTNMSCLYDNAFKGDIEAIPEEPYDYDIDLINDRKQKGR